MPHGVQVVDDRTAPEVEEVLAAAAVASAPSLPAADVGEGVLHRHALSELGSALWCQLPFPEFLQQAFVGMDVHAATGGTGGTLLPQRAELTLLLRGVHGCVETEGDDHCVGTANGTGLPVERKGGLCVASTIAYRPRLAIDLQVLGSVADQSTGQIAPIEMDLPQFDLLT